MKASSTAQFPYAKDCKEAVLIRRVLWAQFVLWSLNQLSLQAALLSKGDICLCQAEIFMDDLMCLDALKHNQLQLRHLRFYFTKCNSKHNLKLT